MKPFRDLAIKRKLLLLNLIICGAVLFVAIAALFGFQILNFRANFIRDTATLATVVANNSTAALAFKDAKGAAEVVNSLRAKPTVVGALIITADGSTLARFGDTNGVPESSSFPPAGEHRFADGHLLYTAPVELDGKKLGKLYLRANYRRPFLALLGFYAVVIGSVTITSILLAMFLSGKLGRIITEPVLQLAQTAQIVGEKKDYSVRAPVGSRGDELGRLTAAFNQMLSRIEAQDQALKESQERFEVAIAGANDGIWDWNLKTNEVFFSPQWKHIIGYADEEIENKFSSFESLLHPDDVGPTMASLKEYLELSRSTYEVEFRLREKNGQYRWILARGAALRDADNKPYRMAGSHTDINGRKQAEVEVRAAREKFETLVNSLDGIVWEADPATFQMLFVSNQAEAMLGYPLDLWLADPQHWENSLHPDDRIRTVEARKRGTARGKPYQLEYRANTADGRTVWLRDSISVLVENAKPVRIRGLTIDITQQKHAEAELARLNSELMTASRHAGMAEVATGVLHNVGNVLNSVNVSVTLVRENFRHSEISSLIQVAALLREHAADLGTFLTTDTRGKMVPGFVIQLAEDLEQEHVELEQEHERLGKNIEHIKEIVAMQQSYAQVSGCLEKVSLASLVDDVLQIHTTGLERHGIRVRRQFAEVPPVTVDRHKVLQILVNLVHNAKYAMEDSGRADRLLTVEIGINGDNRAKVTVQDNGIGIPQENLTRIFSHGFTTRKGGHGFGLHSGANAAREMGGLLTARSDGLGTGATFTLEFPSTNEQAKQ